MAKPKKEVEETNKILTSKRSMDLHRDEYGNLDNVEIAFDVDNYTFKNLTLNGSVLKDAVFDKIKAQGVDFSKATVKNVTFKDSDLRWITLTTSQKEDNIFENCNTREMNVVS